MDNAYEGKSEAPTLEYTDVRTLPVYIGRNIQINQIAGDTA